MGILNFRIVSEFGNLSADDLRAHHTQNPAQRKPDLRTNYAIVLQSWYRHPIVRLPYHPYTLKTSLVRQAQGLKAEYYSCFDPLIAVFASDKPRGSLAAQAQECK